jgi:hypothetical protein
MKGVAAGFGSERSLKHGPARRAQRRRALARVHGDLPLELIRAGKRAAWWMEVLGRCRPIVPRDSRAAVKLATVRVMATSPTSGVLLDAPPVSWGPALQDGRRLITEELAQIVEQVRRDHLAAGPVGDADQRMACERRATEPRVGTWADGARVVRVRGRQNFGSIMRALKGEFAHASVIWSVMHSMSG